jgi:hypothetical protein
VRKVIFQKIYGSYGCSWWGLNRGSTYISADHKLLPAAPFIYKPPTFVNFTSRKLKLPKLNFLHPSPYPVLPMLARNEFDVALRTRLHLHSTPLRSVLQSACASIQINRRIVFPNPLDLDDHCSTSCLHVSRYISRNYPTINDFLQATLTSTHTCAFVRIVANCARRNFRR